ncbi:hypothetical protein [Phaeobacter sp. NW0010-22]|uniref:hypothetical protein n=1 Tax=Phaeobacter sp. NW0010-22 TaxID=3135907 RepID=UPI0031061759
MTNVLDQLRTMTTVVADTGDLAAVRTYEPIDCTTNQSLVLKALEHAASEDLIAREIEAGKTAGMTDRSPDGCNGGGTCGAGPGPRLD